MKIIGSVKEDLNIEKRISITPETVKKFIGLNFSVFIEKNYGILSRNFKYCCTDCIVHVWLSYTDCGCLESATSLR